MYSDQGGLIDLYGREQRAPQTCWTQEGPGEARGRLWTVVDRVDGGERVVRRGAVAGAGGPGSGSSQPYSQPQCFFHRHFSTTTPAPAEWVCRQPLFVLWEKFTSVAMIRHLVAEYKVVRL